MSTVYPTFQDAYLAELDTTFNEPEYRNAPRGFPSRERLGVSFTIADAVQRHVTLPARRANPIFCFAEALWYLAGTNDLSFISYYAPGIKRYSADGRTLWLSGRYDGHVYGWDTRTGKLIAKIDVGGSPHGLLVWPQPGRYSLGHTGNLR